MNDEDLSRLLRELPREEPSFDFTRRVLEKLDARSLRFRRSRGAVLAWAAAALLGVLLSQGYLRERYQRSRAAARVRELRDEYRELQTELEKLRTLTRELEPVLPLGGTDELEFVFDLRELAREGGGRPRAEPVFHSPSETPLETEKRRP
jgi:hypothetical protein